MEIDTAIDIFADSYTLQRSFAKPAVVLREPGLWRLRDVDPGNKPRTEECLAWQVPAAEVVERARVGLTGPLVISVFARPGGDSDRLKAAYRGLGFRCMRVEPLMVYDLANGGPAGDTSAVARVSTTEQCALLRKHARMTFATTREIADGTIRAFMIESGGEPIAWVRDIHVRAEGSYTANMFTAAEHRRKGLGSALMLALLQAAAKAGAPANVLLASRAGEALYRSLGYRTIASLLIFVPPSDKSAP